MFTYGGIPMVKRERIASESESERIAFAKPLILTMFTRITMPTRPSSSSCSPPGGFQWWNGKGSQVKVKVKGKWSHLQSPWFSPCSPGSPCPPDHHHHHVHLRGDSDGVAGDGGPPDHQVGVEGDPDDRPKEGDWEELPSWKRESVSCERFQWEFCHVHVWLSGCSATL